MRDPFFFGYGSLVNTRTHSYQRPAPARLSGWTRVWRHTTTRELAYLSARPKSDAVIDGLIAHVPGEDWIALDEREYGYVRQGLSSDAVFHELVGPLDIHIYHVDTGPQLPPDLRHPILLSYLDVVVQGFAQVYGIDGVTRFFETTEGWDLPILDDRRAPRYPRHQQLTADETDLVDRHLNRISARIEQL